MIVILRCVTVTLSPVLQGELCLQHLHLSSSSLGCLLKALDGARSKVALQESEVQRVIREVSALLLQFKAYQEQCKTERTANLTRAMQLRQQLAESCFLPHMDVWAMFEPNNTKVGSSSLCHVHDKTVLQFYSFLVLLY